MLLISLEDVMCVALNQLSRIIHKKSQFKEKTPYVGLVLTLKIMFLNQNFAFGL